MKYFTIILLLLCSIDYSKPFLIDYNTLNPIKEYVISNRPIWSKPLLENNSLEQFEKQLKKNKEKK